MFCNWCYFLRVSGVFNVVPKKPMKPMFSSAMSSNSYLAIDNGRITGMVTNFVLSFLTLILEIIIARRNCIHINIKLKELSLQICVIFHYSWGK